MIDYTSRRYTYKHELIRQQHSTILLRLFTLIYFHCRTSLLYRLLFSYHSKFLQSTVFSQYKTFSSKLLHFLMFLNLLEYSGPLLLLFGCSARNYTIISISLIYSWQYSNQASCYSETCNKKQQTIHAFGYDSSQMLARLLGMPST